MELKDSGQENVPLGSFEMEEDVGGTQKNLRRKKIIIYSIIGLSIAIIIGLIIFLSIHFSQNNNSDDNGEDYNKDKSSDCWGPERNIYLKVISNNNDEEILFFFERISNS